MFAADHPNASAQYADFAERPEPECRPWPPQSQAFVPGDVLLHLLDEGWQMYRRVFVESYFCASHRCVQVYHFVLMRGPDRLSVRVISNPAVRRLAQHADLVKVEARSS